MTSLNRVATGAHRAAWIIVNGPIPDGMWVLHRCDNPPCVRPDHLFLGTNADNIRDKTEKGRAQRGDNSGPRRHPERIQRGMMKSQAKLTDDTVRTIRALAADGVTRAELGRRFGITGGNVTMIVQRKRWKHVA